MFTEMIRAIQEGIVSLIFKVRLMDPTQGVVQRQIQGCTNVDSLGVSYGVGSSADGSSEEALTPRRVDKVGRNEPCPCGSGKKYKKCCWNKK